MRLEITGLEDGIWRVEIDGVPTGDLPGGAESMLEVRCTHDYRGALEAALEMLIEFRRRAGFRPPSSPEVGRRELAEKILRQITGWG